MAGSDRTPTTDQNHKGHADTQRHIQGTTLVVNCTVPEYKAGDHLVSLRSSRKVLRAAVTRLLKAATELRQAASPSVFDLLEAMAPIMAPMYMAPIM